VKNKFLKKYYFNIFLNKNILKSNISKHFKEASEII